MSVDLSIKRVPDDLAERLRARAARNHRSLQGELMAILEQSAGPARPLTPREVYEHAKALGHVDTGESVVETIRRMREERTEHLMRRVEGRSKRHR